MLLTPNPPQIQTPYPTNSPPTKKQPDQEELQTKAALALIRRARANQEGGLQKSQQLPIFREYPNDPVSWLEKHFMIPETPDHHLILMPYQKAMLRKALTKRPDGTFPYSLILWSDIKKSIKSVIAAGVALWLAWNTEWGSIKIIANDLKQADSRESFYIRRAIELHPIMREMVKVKPSGYLIELPNHARIESIPVDPKGEAGGNDDGIFFTELWAANNEAAQRLWTELTVSPTKYGKSFRWVETYAGFTGKSPLLENLYKSGVEEGTLMPLSARFNPPLPIYENKAARMISMWNKVPRCPWQKPEYYAEEQAILLPSEFNRVHRNEWSTPSDAFIPNEWWANCYGKMTSYSKDQTHIMALDAAVDGDTFGVLLLAGNGNENYYVRYAHAWKPPGNGQHIDYMAVETEVLSLLNEYNVAEICYDPYQLEEMSQRIRQNLIAHLHPFNQGQPRLIADKLLRDMIRERRVHHENIEVLTQHVLNADAKTDGDKLRIVKRNAHMKIDLCVCLSMAVARALYWQL
jgi:phage terminase large subunit-like protein